MDAGVQERAGRGASHGFGAVEQGQHGTPLGNGVGDGGLVAPVAGPWHVGEMLGEDPPRVNGLRVGVALFDHDVDGLAIGRYDFGISFEDAEDYIHVLGQRDDTVFRAGDVDVR